MSTSQLPAVIDALVSTLTSGLTVPVYDGPLPAWMDAQFVIVGDDGDPTTDDAANVTQTWAGIGKRSRDEDGALTCVAVAQSGDLGAKTVRDQAYALLADCENALRTDPTLGGVLASPGVAQVTSHDLHQQTTSRGQLARVVFTVSYQARI